MTAYQMGINDSSHAGEKGHAEARPEDIAIRWSTPGIRSGVTWTSASTPFRSMPQANNSSVRLPTFVKE